MTIDPGPSRLDLDAIWSVSSFHKGHSSDEMIVQITKRTTGLRGWWGRVWRKEKPITYKVAFTGRAFEWFQQPRYNVVTDTETKYRLYDLWYEANRGSWVRD